MNANILSDNTAIIIRQFQMNDQQQVANIFEKGLTSYGPPDSDTAILQQWFVKSKLCETGDMYNIFNSYKCSTSDHEKIMTVTEPNIDEGEGSEKIKQIHNLILSSFYNFWVAVIPKSNENDKEINDDCDEVVGCIAVIPSVDPVTNRVTALELQRMSVSHKHHRLGIASKLVTHLENFARMKKINRVFLSTLTTMDKAVSFYRRIGYTEVEAKKFYFGDLELPTKGDYVEIANFEKILLTDC